MEYCAGGDLLSLIQAKKFIPEFIVRRFLQQIGNFYKVSQLFGIFITKVVL